MNSIVTYTTIVICILNYFRFTQLKKGYGYSDALIRSGALVKPLYNKKQIWRVLTAGFVHMSISHLLLNIYCIYSIGRYIESLLGSVSYLILLLGSIICGNLFELYVGDETSISGGLSSGIYGLLAFELKLIYMSGGISAILSSPGILATLIINLGFNFMPGIGYKAHLGGAIFGVAFITIMSFI